MAHYAILDKENTVVNVITGRDEDEVVDGIDDWESYYGQLHSARCVRTSYNGNIRKQFAGIGYTYNEEADVFIKPQPFASWSLNDNFDWEPPAPYPEDGVMYQWNEELVDWEATDFTEPA